MSDLTITESDYKLVESPNVEFYGIKLLTGKYKNVLYIYGEVSIKESPELDIATLAFTYDIQESGSFEEQDLINDIEFKNYIGAVLQNIMENSLDHAKENNLSVIGIGHNESNTDSRTESSN